MAKEEVSLDQKIRLFLAGVITIAWAISFIVDIRVKDYEPPASLHPLMMIVAGAVFGEGLVRSAIKQVIEKQAQQAPPPQPPYQYPPIPPATPPVQPYVAPGEPPLPSQETPPA